MSLLLDNAKACGMAAAQRVLTREGVRAMFCDARKKPPAVLDEHVDEEYGVPSCVRDETASEQARLMHCMCDDRVRPNLVGVAQVFVIFF